MTHPKHEPAPRHQQIIATALEDWWIDADPATPINPTEAAAQIDTYLVGSGYTISYRTRTPTRPSRAQIAFTAFLALACLAGSLISLARDEWGWAVAALFGGGALTHTLVEELIERRSRRRT